MKEPTQDGPEEGQVDPAEKRIVVGQTGGGPCGPPIGGHLKRVLVQDIHQFAESISESRSSPVLVTVISISRNALIDPPNGIRGLFEYVVRFLGYSEEGIPIMYEELYDFKRLGTSKGLEDLKERTLANLRGVLTAYHRTKILRRSAPQIMPRFYLEQKALDDIEMAAMRRETSRLGLTPF